MLIYHALVWLAKHPFPLTVEKELLVRTGHAEPCCGDFSPRDRVFEMLTQGIHPGLIESDRN